MSKTSTLKKTTRHLNGLAAFGIMITVAQAANASSPAIGKRPLSQERSDTLHSIQVNKALVSKRNKIRLFPDAKQQVLFFSATGDDKKVYQLYLFDMDGRLVNQASIRNRETTVLSALSEGNYLFEVFTDDERIENGHLVVR